MEIKVDLPTMPRKTAAITVDESTTVQNLLDNLIQEHGKLKPDSYFLYYPAGKTKWVLNNKDKTLSDFNVGSKASLTLLKKYQNVDLKLVSGKMKSSQIVLVDLSKPLSFLRPLIARKFQIVDPENYGFFNLGHDAELPLNKTIPDLGVPLTDLYIENIPAKKKQEELRRQEAAKEILDGTFEVTAKQQKKKGRFYVKLEDKEEFSFYKQKEDDTPVLTLKLSDYDLVPHDTKSKKTVELHSKAKQADTIVLKPSTDEEVKKWFDYIHETKGSAQSEGIFGAPLKAGCKEGQNIPDIVEQAIKYIDERALEVEGIFRLSGSQILIEQYRDKFNQGVDVVLAHENDPHTVAGLLKLYFREMPEPILTYDLYDSFLAAQAEKDTEKQRFALRTLIRQLPSINQAVLTYLMKFLIRVERYADVNMMAIHNLATVFAPNLLAPKVKNVFKMVEDTPLVHGIVNSFLKEYDYLFKEDEIVKAKALYEYIPNSENEIGFAKDAILFVTQQRADGWWVGKLDGIDDAKVGLFPASYVKVVPAVSKRQQFIEELGNVMDQVKAKQTSVRQLKEEQAQLQKEIENIEKATKTAKTENQALCANLAEVIKANPDLANLASKLEVFFTERASVQTVRTAAADAKAALLSRILLVVNDAKITKAQKFKDLLQIIDLLIRRATDETEVRQKDSETQGQIMQSLAALQIVLKK